MGSVDCIVSGPSTNGPPFVIWELERLSKSELLVSYQIADSWRLGPMVVVAVDLEFQDDDPDVGLNEGWCCVAWSDFPPDNIQDAIQDLVSMKLGPKWIGQDSW